MILPVKHKLPFKYKLTYLKCSKLSNKKLLFEGCLEDVQVGGTPPISFFRSDQAGGFLEGTAHFVLKKRRNILDDQCYAKEQCGSMNPCKNGAVCRDLWNLRICECQPGTTGTFCEVVNFFQISCFACSALFASSLDSHSY